jgi:L-malate glycosyltransferase
MKTVLHIAGHMGGGIGKVLSGVALAESGYEHDIILLGDKTDAQFSDKCIKDGIKVRYTNDLDYIMWAVSNADIVHLDWWGYPLLNKIMMDIKDLKMRLVIWSHVSGCYYPYIPVEFATLPHKFVFTSQYSYENSYWKPWDRVLIRNKCPIVNSSGGFANTFEVPLKKHDGFNIGYLGTLKYIKLNPHFIEFCKGAKHIPDVKFLMIGTIPQPNRILIEAKEAGIDHLFEFTGHVPDVSVELARLDVLGYPLNPYSYVTSENSMLEAMSMGIPPVCLNQGAEKYLVRDNITGYLVKNVMEYEMIMEYLYKNPDTKKRVGNRARTYVLENLNIANTIRKMDIIYDDVMAETPRTFDFASAIGSTPYKWYQSSIPPCGIDEVLPHLYDDSKSSILQWYKHFPNDGDIAAEARWAIL